MWKYKVVECPSQPLNETELNEYGEMGWELITAVHHTEATHYAWVYIFKYLKEN